MSKNTSSAPTTEVGAALFQGKTILIVEASEPCFLLLEAMLAESAAIIVREKDGHSAKTRFLKHSGIDLAIMEVILPGIDGLELSKFFKETRPDFPIVLYTAFPQDECKDALYDAFLLKPIARTDLLAAIQKLLYQKH